MKILNKSLMFRLVILNQMDDAINQACLTLECTHLHQGVISKGEGKSGFMVVTNQELEAI